MGWSKAAPDCKAYRNLRRLILIDHRNLSQSVYKFSFHYPLYKPTGPDFMEPCWMRVCVRYVRQGCKPTWRQMVEAEGVPKDPAANARIAKAVFDGIRNLPLDVINKIDGKALRGFLFEIREEVDARDLARKMRAAEAPKVDDFSGGMNLPIGTIVGGVKDMQIRAGDVFNDGEARFTVFGFKIAEDSENGKVMLCKTQDGDTVEIDPWVLYETCNLETATTAPDSLCFFDTKGAGAK